MGKDKSFFATFAEKIACFAGSSTAFALAAGSIIVWAVTGPIFGFSETWQLVINTGTTIVTFLMVFLVQNSQNRDSKALQLKLDELIRATEGAHTVLMNLEELDEEELDAIRSKYRKIAHKGRERLNAGKSDTNMPEVKQLEENFLDETA